jgi:hypothetical protein
MSSGDVIGLGRASPAMTRLAGESSVVARSPQGERGSRDFGAVLLGELEQTDFIDRAEITSGELEGDVTPELRNPEAAALHVHMLPARRLDVGVRDVVSGELALTGNFTSGH